MQTAKHFEEFLKLSEVLTGFSRLELLGTGMSETYYNVLVPSVGERLLSGLLTAFGEIAAKAGGKTEALEASVRDEIMASPEYGPLAKNIIKMWYLGSWLPLPDDWCRQYGVAVAGASTVLSAEAYKEGLVWPAIGTHPPGAKQPGFASWSFPPLGAGIAVAAKGRAS